MVSYYVELVGAATGLLVEAERVTFHDNYVVLFNGVWGEDSTFVAAFPRERINSIGVFEKVQRTPKK